MLQDHAQAPGLTYHGMKLNEGSMPGMLPDINSGNDERLARQQPLHMHCHPSLRWTAADHTQQGLHVIGQGLASSLGQGSHPLSGLSYGGCLG